ncbi:hypothetical protein OYC64_009204 [Pagothenia borchgrevinki]|uniref:Membrane insertase YidC/Oxa/ALB C-terminal domain-containing protein n=1 Tax=Pagothenia borchgrevinki TaxID=8213 RepID=A0ABD2H3R5_PAGBO
MRTLSGLGTLSGMRSLSGMRTLSGLGTLSGMRSLSGMRTLSGLWTLSGVRRLSGGPDGVPDGVPGGVGVSEGVPDAVGVSGGVPPGCYSSLSDSALVHLVEHFLLTVQQVGGLPWWLSIVVATLSVRTAVTLPLAAYQTVVLARVEALQVEISELAKRLRYEVSVRARERSWTEKQSRFQFKKNLRRIVSQLYVRENCHPFKASLLIWVQLPLWISLSLALRNLTLDQSALHADLAAGGALWFPDLTVPDSTWILPLALGLTNLIIVEVFSLQRVNPSRLQRIVTNSIRGFSVLMVPIAATVPSGLALYWLSSSLIGLSHNLLLRSRLLHRLLRLKTVHQSETPYRDLLSAFKSKYCR